MERFYSKVNPMVHNRNLLKDSIILEEKAEAYQLKKALRLKENDIRIKAVRAKYVRELRASRAAEEAEVCVASTDGVLIVEDLPEVPKRDKATPKNWNKTLLVMHGQQDSTRDTSSNVVQQQRR